MKKIAFRATPNRLKFGRISAYLKTTFISTVKKTGGAVRASRQTCQRVSPEVLIPKYFLNLRVLRMTPYMESSVILIATVADLWKSAIPYSCSTSKSPTVRSDYFQNKTS